jgi:lysyl-tRNA synthetase class 2
MDRELLEIRARIIRETRAFFDGAGYLEVDTPLLAPNLIPESCLEVFETALEPPAGSRDRRRPLWLVPSPEIWMKPLIARHRISMYQICRCFRNGESRGRLHSPEFTMLEYYTMDADYLDSLAVTEDLFRRLEPFAAGNAGALRPPFARLTVEEAFTRWAGFSLYAAAERGAKAMEEAARSLGLDPPPGLGTAALYDLIFIHAVEPKLPRGRPVALMDYPAFVPCLAQNRAGGYAKERWELYVNGIELANCYSEETDAAKVRAFFESEGAEKERQALVPHAVDPDYWRVFAPANGQGFPRCSGVALGLDRLIMALTGKSSIDAVIPFAS